jgi:hypothetical protein
MALWVGFAVCSQAGSVAAAAVGGLPARMPPWQGSAGTGLAEQHAMPHVKEELALTRVTQERVDEHVGVVL